jgi:hypothetical protein
MANRRRNNNAAKAVAAALMAAPMPVAAVGAATVAMTAFAPAAYAQASVCTLAGGTGGASGVGTVTPVIPVNQCTGLETAPDAPPPGPDRDISGASVFGALVTGAVAQDRAVPFDPLMLTTTDGRTVRTMARGDRYDGLTVNQATVGRLETLSAPGLNLSDRFLSQTQNVCLVTPRNQLDDAGPAVEFELGNHDRATRRMVGTAVGVGTTFLSSPPIDGITALNATLNGYTGNNLEDTIGKIRSWFGEHYPDMTYEAPIPGETIEIEGGEFTVVDFGGGPVLLISWPHNEGRLVGTGMALGTPGALQEMYNQGVGIEDHRGRDVDCGYIDRWGIQRATVLRANGGSPDFTTTRPDDIYMLGFGNAGQYEIPGLGVALSETTRFEHRVLRVRAPATTPAPVFAAPPPPPVDALVSQEPPPADPATRRVVRRTGGDEAPAQPAAPAIPAYDGSITAEPVDPNSAADGTEGIDCPPGSQLMKVTYTAGDGSTQTAFVAVPLEPDTRDTNLNDGLDAKADGTYSVWNSTTNEFEPLTAENRTLGRQLDFSDNYPTRVGRDTKTAILAALDVDMPCLTGTACTTAAGLKPFDDNADNVLTLAEARDAHGMPEAAFNAMDLNGDDRVALNASTGAPIAEQAAPTVETAAAPGAGEGQSVQNQFQGNLGMLGIAGLGGLLAGLGGVAALASRRRKPAFAFAGLSGVAAGLGGAAAIIFGGPLGWMALAAGIGAGALGGWLLLRRNNGGNEPNDPTAGDEGTEGKGPGPSGGGDRRPQITPVDAELNAEPAAAPAFEPGPAPVRREGDDGEGVKTTAADVKQQMLAEIKRLSAIVEKLEARVASLEGKLQAKDELLAAKDAELVELRAARPSAAAMPHMAPANDRGPLVAVA